MARGRRIHFAVAGAVAVALMLPAAAQGTVTIGSKLSSTPDIALGGGPWTVFQNPLGSQFQAPGGLVSRVNGTITQWRLRVGPETTATAFRVIRTLAGGLYTGAGTSSTVTPAPNKVNTFATQLPIAIGDRIGINCCANPGANYFAQNPTGIRKEIQPLLVDGGPGRSTVQTDGREILLNADIEPTSTFSVAAVQRVKHGGLLITAVLPNPGTLTAGDQRDATIAVAAKKKKKKRPQLLKRVSVSLTSPGSTQLQVFPTKAARVALRQGRKVKAGLKLAFTPTGGTSSSQILSFRLRR